MTRSVTTSTNESNRLLTAAAGGEDCVTLGETGEEGGGGGDLFFDLRIDGDPFSVFASDFPAGDFVTDLDDVVRVVLFLPVTNSDPRLWTLGHTQKA